MKYFIALVILFALFGCKSSDRQKIQLDLWLIEARDQTLYRSITMPDGSKGEEFFEINAANRNTIKRYACMRDDDRKKWLDYLDTRCTCN